MADRKYDWRKDVILAIEVLGLVALCVYTVFSILQWAQIRWTNRLTRESLDSSGTTLQQTLDKMQLQIEATGRLADEAQKQAAGTQKVATNSGRQATATIAGNQLLADAVRPVLRVTDWDGYGKPDNRGAILGPLFFGTPGKTSFHFQVENTGAGDAKNIRYAVSNAYKVGTEYGQRSTQLVINEAIKAGNILGVNPQMGRIGDMKGHMRSPEQTVIFASSAVPPESMLNLEIGEWFYGEIYWDDPYGITPHWKLVFCFLVEENKTQSASMRPCGIPQEGVHAVESH